MKTLREITSRTSQRLGLLFLVGLLGGGCQTAKDDFKFSIVPADVFHDTRDGGLVDSAYASHRFVTGEVIIVHFPGVVPHEERIRDDGSITLPLVGAVVAVDKTPGELQKEICNLYGPRHYKSLPTPFERPVYYVGGQVRSSGRQEYLGRITVLKAIASAGDFTDFANRKKVILTRSGGQRIIVNCVKAAVDSTLDLAVFPGDKIEVPKRIW